MNVRNYIKIGIVVILNIIVLNVNVVFGQDEFSFIEDTEVLQNVAFNKEQKRQLNCMADNIYYEAGKESTEGKIAVAQVVMNRVNSGRFPDSPCKVIQQKTKVSTGLVVCQFSWYCSKSLQSRPKNPERWSESFDVAKAVLIDGLQLPKLEQALFFHAVTVSPGWKNTKKVTKIGNHIFYKEKPRPPAKKTSGFQA